jgi:hypothetical protein
MSTVIDNNCQLEQAPDSVQGAASTDTRMPAESVADLRARVATKLHGRLVAMQDAAGRVLRQLSFGRPLDFGGEGADPLDDVNYLCSTLAQVELAQALLSSLARIPLRAPTPP